MAVVLIPTAVTYNDFFAPKHVAHESTQIPGSYAALIARSYKHPVVLVQGKTQEVVLIDGQRVLRQKPRPVWHTAHVLVTEYVVNPAERGKCEVYTSLTASGTKARKGSIATDTRRFPFGTKFLIPGYGHGTAVDTGGAVVGLHLDAAVESCREAFAWGARHLTVKWR